MESTNTDNRTWENIEVVKIGKFGESEAINNFTHKLFLFIISCIYTHSSVANMVPSNCFID